jgi:hypothetical protein
MSNLLKRLERIEAACQDSALVLRLDDGTKAVLPQAADLEVFHGFMMLVNEGTFCTPEGEPIPMEWVQAIARSIPELDERTYMTGTRELCRRYLAGEEL